MRLPAGPDWTQWATRLEANAKIASDAMLLRDHDKTTEHLYEAQNCLNKWVEWMIAYASVNKL